MRTTTPQWVGFVLDHGDPYAVVDLDHCRDSVSGDLTPEAAKIIRQLDSYTEVSPSGTGLHIWGRAKLPQGGRRKGGIEMYDAERYFTMTGDHLPDTPLTIEERTPEVLELHSAVFQPNKLQAQVMLDSGFEVGPQLSDAEVLQRARSARNGDKFGRLFNGDTTGYNSPSEADLALCVLLAYWTSGSPAQIDRLFRCSGLYRGKWDSSRGNGGTYGEMTIKKSLTSSPSSTCSPTRGIGLESDDDESNIVQFRKEIRIGGRQLDDVTAEAVAALEAANDPPELFVRSGALFRVVCDEQGRPTMQPVQENELRNRISRVVDFKRLIARTRQWVDAEPPALLLKNILAEKGWSFPALKGIVEAPALRPDGTVLDCPGYDPSTGLVYIPSPTLTMPEIPHTPSPGDRRRARAVLEDAIADFPFVDSASTANALGLLLTSVMRPAIRGQVPLAFIDAPKQGSGKTLLAKIVVRVSTGRCPAVGVAPTDESEWRKRITTLLCEVSSVIIIDNFEGKLDSPTLAGALTGGEWTDRRLGKNETITVAQLSTWIVTGNNVQLGRDLPRRCYWIRLDPQTEKPWQGRTFRHKDLEHWVQQNRGELVGALLTLARSWFADGRKPCTSPILGGFESWSETIGGVLEHAGVTGFLSNLQSQYEDADEDGPQWGRFLGAIYSEFGAQSFTVGELVRRLDNSRAFRDALPENLRSEYSGVQGRFRQILGNAFRREKDALYDTYRLMKAGKDGHAKVVAWRVEDTSSEKHHRNCSDQELSAAA